MSSKNEAEQKLQELSKEDLIKVILALSSEMECLKKKLAKYENPHVPSSQQQFKPETKKEEKEEKPRFPGAPPNHNGAGIRLPKPDKTVEHKLDNKKLKCIGKYIRTVIDFVDKPIEVTKHVIYQYITPGGQIVEPEIDLPEGIYGKNLQAFLSELKAIGGISYEKLADFIKTLRPDLSICSATILAIVDGIGKKLETPRKKIQTKIQNSPYVQADETGMRQDGKNGYVWAFCNPDYALYEYDPSRARAVAERVLGKDYGGWVVSDGYNAYEIYKQQRCWSHILREGDALALDYPEAELQAQRLHGIYKSADAAKCELPDKRHEIVEKLSGLTELGHIIEILRVTEGCKKFSGTLQRALPHLFVGVENPDVPLHNNFGERMIRPVVIHRKMMGCIRNDKGRRFINNIMSMVQTWKLQGKNIHKNLIRYAN